MAQPALGSIGDAARWRDSFRCAALADTDGDDDMRVVILKKVALRKEAKCSGGRRWRWGFFLYIRTLSLEIEGGSILTPTETISFRETTNERINTNVHVLR